MVDLKTFFELGYAKPKILPRCQKVNVKVVLE